MIRRATTRGLALTLAFMALAAASAFTKADAVQRDVWPSQWAQEFEPKALYAEAGDTVKWWGLEKGHDVEGYAGAGYEKVASSGHIYSTTFGGGTVYYRCTLHSAWSWREKCTGMCGAITDRNSPPITPTIARPLSGDVNQNPVRISGQSDPWNFVAIYGTDGVELDRFLAKADGSWASWIRLPMGANTITAATINPDGSTSAKTSPRQINVTWPGDYTPPTGAFSASVSAHQGPVTILTGTAEDAVAVETIRIRIIKAGVYGS